MLTLRATSLLAQAVTPADPFNHIKMQVVRMRKRSDPRPQQRSKIPAGYALYQHLGTPAAHSALRLARSTEWGTAPRR